MDFGKIIMDRRHELGLTLEQVGDYVGVGKSTVRKWEAGTIQNLRRDKIALLAAVLRMDPLDLLDVGQPAKNDQPILAEDELRLVEAYRCADERARTDAMNILATHPKQSGGIK